MPSSEVKDILAESTDDEPLPDEYNLDRIYLSAQSPLRLFLYWEHADDPLVPLRLAFNEAVDGYELTVRLIEVESGDVRWEKASPEQHHWFDARPGLSYRAEVGFHAEGRTFVRVLSSATISTPRSDAAPQLDRVTLCRVPAADFNRLLHSTGDARGALGDFLKEADQLTGGRASLSVARRYRDALDERVKLTDAVGTGDGQAPDDDGAEPLAGNGVEGPDERVLEVPEPGDYKEEELRLLITDLAFGRSYDDINESNKINQIADRLSLTLLRWLEQINFLTCCLNPEEVFDTVLLMEIIREAVCGITPPEQPAAAADEPPTPPGPREEAEGVARLPFYVWGAGMPR